jgi:LmbE family N-acetylglucosaminyl deacetylase
MIELLPRSGEAPLRVLCLGAHSDDIEIGCGGTIMQWLRDGRPLDVTWVVCSAPAARRTEATRSAQALLRGAARRQVVVGELEDSHFPSQMRELKALCRQIRDAGAADVIFTHHVNDLHQDHRALAEVTWQTWRDQLVLEYEIPKFEGDLGQPNAFVPLAGAVARRKVDHLMRHFGTQRTKSWFRPSTFEALMTLRGIECRAPAGVAEAFHARKIRISVSP